ncbi:MAG: 4Fe-4S dicluster domain-containing protein [Elusimicrobiota bacterium]
MNKRSLLWIRPLVQALFLALSLAVFFGLIQGRPWAALYRSIHLFPSLSHLGWVSLWPFWGVTLLFLFLPLLAGRLYCSWLCPAGFLQDALARIRTRRTNASTPFPLRVFLLFLCVGSLAFGYAAYELLDHFTNLGRLYGIASVPFGRDTALALLFLGCLGAALRRPRWFCNTLCPTGTLSAALQSRAAIRLSISSSCGDCGLCRSLCPADCIRGDSIDHTRCIHCFECWAHCPKGAVRFRPDRPSPKGRAAFLKTASGAVLGLALGPALAKKVLGGEPDAVIPPGGKSVEVFRERCASCLSCVSVCPTKVLTADRRGNVLLDFSRGYCSFDCDACLCSCPTGAISRFPLEAKKRIKIGTSDIDRTLCIPYSKGRDCAACHEVCPVGAVRLQKLGEVSAPIVDPEYCIGCGACQFACPVEPKKAITVTPAKVHGVAFSRNIGSAGSGFPF